MKKILSLILVLLTSILFATELQPSIEVDIGISNNYVWRGVDMHESAQTSKTNPEKPVTFNTTPTAIPTVTIFGPSGFSANLWAAYGLTNRDEKDGAIRATDILAFTISYDFTNRLGNFVTSYALYTFPTTVNTVLDSYEELIIKYTLPVILSPTIGIATSSGTGGNSYYNSFGISHTILNAGSITIDPSLTAGLWTFHSEAKSSWAHLDLILPITYSLTSVNMYISSLLSYRGFAGSGSSNQPFAVMSNININNKGETRPNLIATLTIGAVYTY